MSRQSVSPKTCVVVVNYNTPEETRRCLESLAASTVPVRAVVVDNASTRGDLVEVCAGFQWVELIRSAENLGFGRGNNLGLRWALEKTECEYFFLLNSDAFVEPETLGRLERFLQERPEAGIASPRIVYARDPDVIWYGGGEINWRRGGARGHGFRQPFDGREEPVQAGFVSGCALFIRRSTLLQLGGFDPLFFMYAEDVEYSARAARAGVKMFYLPLAVALHDVHASIRLEGGYFDHYESLENRNLAFFLEHGFCNLLITYRRHAPLLDSILGFSYLFARWTLLGIKCILRARVDVFTGLLRGLYRYLSLPSRDYVDELAGLQGRRRHERQG